MKKNKSTVLRIVESGGFIGGLRTFEIPLSDLPAEVASSATQYFDLKSTALSNPTNTDNSNFRDGREVQLELHVPLQQVRSVCLGEAHFDAKLSELIGCVKSLGRLKT